MASKAEGKRASVASVREPVDKDIQKMPLMKSKLQLGNVSISNQASWSFTGLLAAQRMTKNLKERRALKGTKKIDIVTPQPPSFASRPSEKVQVTAIKQILEGYLPGKIGEMAYDTALAPSLAKEISEEVKGLVKRVLPARYKALCIVNLGKREQEDIIVVSRCLWDPYSDSYVAHVYQNSSLFCVVSVYAVYFE
ncbi:dynein light chain Tctex-type 5-like [Spea bombifrons]|uniref:dynein light chain Tctex-type 5-like n=1 Tax=Spea bombifrons TaxID=233779 RepID=UPI00234AB7B2|nr:dynein light chain Tctex-type 5-like [Spea bombifrons]